VIEAIDPAPTRARPVHRLDAGDLASLSFGSRAGAAGLGFDGDP
jgi:hypothetical protein